MKGFGEKHKNLKKKKINNDEQTIKDQIISRAFKQHSQGNIQEAKKYYENFINKGFMLNFVMVHNHFFENSMR